MIVFFWWEFHINICIFKKGGGRLLQKEQATDGDLLRKLSKISIKRERKEEKEKEKEKKKQELRGQRYDKEQNGK